MNCVNEIREWNYIGDVYIQLKINRLVGIFITVKIIKSL